MTRAKLLATTTALLLPVTGAFAQSVDADAGVNAGAAGGNASVGATVENGTAADAVDTTANAVGDAVEDAGEAAESTAKSAAESADQALDNVADTMTPEADATAETDVTAEADTTTVGEVIGMDVVDAAGETIGSVEQIVEQADGKAAVIGVGGFLGLGEHDVAIPASDLTLASDGQLKLDGYTEEYLRQRPAFNSTDAVSLDANVELPEIG